MWAIRQRAERVGLAVLTGAIELRAYGPEGAWLAVVTMDLLGSRLQLLERTPANLVQMT